MTKGEKTGLTAIGILGGLTGLYFFFTKKNAINQLRYRLSDAKISLSGTAILLKIDLIVTNPTNTSLQFKNFVGKIYVDNTDLGTLDIPNPTLLNSKSETTVTLTSIIGASKLITNVLDVISTGKLPSKGILDGILNVGNIQMRIYEVFNLKS